jgi:hypothetical protein
MNKTNIAQMVLIAMVTSFLFTLLLKFYFEIKYNDTLESLNKIEKYLESL